MPTGPDDASAPWIRLAGAMLLGLTALELVLDGAFTAQLVRVHQPDELRVNDLHQANRMLELWGTTSLCTVLASVWCMAALLAVVARVSPRLRPLASLGALAFAASTSYWLASLVLQLGDGGLSEERLASLEPWRYVSEIALLVAWADAAVIVLLRTRGGPRFAAACVGAGVVVLAALIRLFTSPLVFGEDPPTWWFEPVLGVSTATWIYTASAIGLGLGLWIAGDPERDASPRRFDAAAARALRLARTLLWLRLGVALGAMLLLWTATWATQKAQQQATFGGGGRQASSGPSWVWAMVPWLGLLELVLVLLMIVALGAAVLQRRSRLAAVLVAAGTMLLVFVATTSFALDAGLYKAMRSGIEGAGWGDGVRNYTELAAGLQPSLRWLGLAGMGTTLAGLTVLVRTIGHRSPKRAVRAIAIMTIFTTGWLYGREMLGVLGLGVLLLAPIAFVAAIWMFLDIVTILGEAAAALEAEPTRS